MAGTSRRPGGRSMPRHLGWAVAAVGVLLLVLGWYGVSGEAVVARQLPYLASATLPGAALLVCGAVLVAVERTARRSAETERRVAELHALLVEPVQELTPAAGADDDGGRLAVAGGSRVHRRGCPLLAGKEARPVSPEDVAALGLRDCPLCDPTSEE
jgi:hypothetical protein